MHIAWEEYKTLFGAQETIDVLNLAAPNFFFHLDRMSWHDMLLRICRLLDPPSQGGKRNLTLENLTDLISTARGKKRFVRYLKVCRERSGFARDWRNRGIAHKDFALGIGDESAALAGASRQKVEDALKVIAATMNVANRELGLGEHWYSHSVPSLAGAGALLRCLRDAQSFRRLHRK